MDVIGGWKALGEWLVVLGQFLLIAIPIIALLLIPLVLIFHIIDKNKGGWY